MSNNTGKQPQPGFYRHYKGRYYQLLAIVRHSEEDASYAMYRALYGDFGLWVRPLEMFCEEVLIDGLTVARFAFAGSAVPDGLHLPSPLPEPPLWSGFALQ